MNSSLYIYKPTIHEFLSSHTWVKINLSRCVAKIATMRGLVPPMLMLKEDGIFK